MQKFACSGFDSLHCAQVFILSIQAFRYDTPPIMNDDEKESCTVVIK